MDKRNAYELTLHLNRLKAEKLRIEKLIYVADTALNGRRRFVVIVSENDDLSFEQDKDNPLKVFIRNRKIDSSGDEISVGAE